MAAEMLAGLLRVEGKVNTLVSDQHAAITELTKECGDLRRDRNLWESKAEALEIENKELNLQCEDLEGKLHAAEDRCEELTSKLESAWGDTKSSSDYAKDLKGLCGQRLDMISDLTTKVDTIEKERDAAQAKVAELTKRCEVFEDARDVYQHDANILEDENKRLKQSSDDLAEKLRVLQLKCDERDTEASVLRSQLADEQENLRDAKEYMDLAVRDGKFSADKLAEAKLELRVEKDRAASRIAELTVALRAASV